MAEPQKYVLAKPVGEAETGRLDLQHRMWLIQHDGLLYTAPLSLSHNQRIVDIGCGTGIWSIAFATKHPDSHVLGLDITPPDAKYTPPNCTFAVADIEGDWSFVIEAFDYIFGRTLATCIRDWPRFMKRCLQHLKPGGWLELNDLAQIGFFAEDACDEADSSMLKWFRVVHNESLRKNGVNIDDTPKHAQQLRDVGFADVSELVWKCRVGTKRAKTEKEKALGTLLCQNLPVLIEGATATAIEHGDLGGMSEQEALDLAEEAKRDVLENADRNGYYILLATYVGQAPRSK